MTKQLWKIAIVRLQRKDGDPQELGLALNNGHMGVIDREGKLVEDKDIFLQANASCFRLNIESLFKVEHAILVDSGFEMKEM